MFTEVTYQDPALPALWNKTSMVCAASRALSPLSESSGWTPSPPCWSTRSPLRLGGRAWRAPSTVPARHGQPSAPARTHTRSARPWMGPRDSCGECGV